MQLYIVIQSSNGPIKMTQFSPFALKYFHPNAWSYAASRYLWGEYVICVARVCECVGEVVRVSHLAGS